MEFSFANKTQKQQKRNIINCRKVLAIIMVYCEKWNENEGKKGRQTFCTQFHFIFRNITRLTIK